MAMADAIHHQYAQHQIGRPDGGGFLRAPMVDRGGSHCRHLRRRVFDAGKNHIAADQRTQHGGDTIKGLGKVQSRRCRPGIAQDGDVGIGTGFQKARADGDDVKRRQEDAIDAQMRRRHEQEGANGIKRQTGDDGLFVAQPADDHGGRQGRAEIADIKGELGEAGLGPRQIQGLLEMVQQQIVELRCQPPGKEQGRGQRKGDDVALFYDW